MKFSSEIYHRAAYTMYMKDCFSAKNLKYGNRGKFKVTYAANVTYKELVLNTLRTGDADLRFYITTVQDG